MNNDTVKARKIVDYINKSIPKEQKKLNVINDSLTSLKTLIKSIQEIELDFPADQSLYFSSKDLEVVIQLIELNGLISMAHLEILISTKNVLLFDNLMERKLHLKHAVLSIYEIDKILKGMPTLKFMVDESETELIKSYHNSLTKQLKEFRRKSKTENLAHLRNNFLSHYNPEFSVMYQVYNNMDVSKLWKTIDDFLDIIVKIKGTIALLSENGLRSQKPFSKETLPIWLKYLND